MKSILVLLATLALFAGCASDKVAFFGNHQAGIITGPQKFVFVAAFDVTAPDASGVRSLLQDWTKASQALTQGLPLGPDGPLSAPAADTGEVLGYKPARLTLTFGAGPGLFDARFGLADRRPAALAPLPTFTGDQLRPEWSDGDLVVQVGADDYQTAYHALHTLTRAAKGRAVVRWVQDGFQPGLEVNPKGPGRNLEGFIDGTVNPDTTKPEVMNQVVWAEAPTTMAGGSYLVVRRIRMLVEVWDRSSLGDQQRTIGRDRAHGAELPTMDADSHVLQARGAGVEKILRRPFHYVNGLDSRTGQWDSGLLFLAWMKDPRLQFVPMQTRLSQNDKLNEYIQVQGSAVFAVFPGVAEGSYLGAGFFPEAPLATRIEALLGAVGATYPALGRQDWDQVRWGAGAWNALWKREREAAGNRAAEIDGLRDQWALTLAANPNLAEVRAAQGRLVQALEAWHRQVQPPTVGSATDLSVLKTRLAAVTLALAASDAEGAKTAFASFQKEWVARESLVRSLDPATYQAAELGISGVRVALTNPAGAPEAVAALSERLSKVKQPSAFGAWDAGVLLLREGMEALLVLAALLAFLARSEQKHRAPWVWAGAATGLAASLVVAVGISLVMATWAGAAPEVVEGLTGLAAVVLMLTVGLWLHQKSSIRSWSLWVRDRVGKTAGSPWALAGLAALAVLREGAETAVFFWGLAGSLSVTDLVLGIGGALVVLTVLGILMMGFSKRLPLNWFLPIATGLIYFLAVKILGQSLGALQSAGWLATTPLGFLGPVEALGFWPTWQTAVPQVVLFLVLGALVVVPLVRKKRA